MSLRIHLTKDGEVVQTLPVSAQAYAVGISIDGWLKPCLVCGMRGRVYLAPGTQPVECERCDGEGVFR